MKKVIIFGSTGMIGQAVLLECLEDNRIAEVLLVNRTTCGIKHPKIKEVLHNDFYNFSSIANQFMGYNACLFCLGITSVGLSEQEYHKITYEIGVAAAEAMLSVNSNISVCYISGAGTDSTERGRTMWARVKGKLENKLIAMPFKGAYMFRPGYIQPLKGIKSKTNWYQFFYIILKPLYFLLKPFKSFVTDSVTLSKAMINAGLEGYSKKVLEVKDINAIRKC